jgi:uncharacterized protein
MNNFFVDPKNNQLRGVWRAFILIALSPLALNFLAQILMSAATESEEKSGGMSLGWGTIISYVVLCGWVILASWGCLKIFEKMRLGSLGFGFFRGCGKEIFLGLLISVAMIVATVALQMIGGGTRIMLNPLFWKTVDGARSLDFTGMKMILLETILTFLLFSFAAAFEELMFRGYAFQTILRDRIPPAIPILVLSIFFGAMHWGNPDSTIFSTVNTILAGVWLSVAYLKTRSLWFATALHVGWNWTMGMIFGLPVSGMKLPHYPILLSTSEAPKWLTGEGYGSEGGAAATLILLVATILIWYSKSLTVAPGMQKMLDAHDTKLDENISLGLAE